MSRKNELNEGGWVFIDFGALYFWG
jgi:hypothetical protein